MTHKVLVTCEFRCLCLNPCVKSGSNLFEDVLFSHQFLSLSIGFGHGNIKDWLTTINDIGHKENHILQQLDGKPEKHKHS